MGTLLKTRSSAAAARELHISQPAVSKHLANLREHFRDPLLIRSGGSTRLTPRAEILSKEASDTLARVYSLFSNTAEANDLPTLNLRIASSNQILNTHLTKIISSSDTVDQKISFTFLPIDDQVEEKMDMGEIDLYLGLLPLPSNIQVTEVPLRSVQIECLMSESHPLARKTSEALTVEELQSYPMVSISTGFSASVQCQEYFQQAGIAPDYQFFFQELEPALALIKETNTLLIASLEAARWYSISKSIVARRLPGTPPAAKGGICWPSYWESSTAHRKIREKIITLAGWQKH